MRIKSILNKIKNHFNFIISKLTRLDGGNHLGNASEFIVKRGFSENCAITQNFRQKIAEIFYVVRQKKAVSPLRNAIRVA
jgi:hypothetical protein